MQKFLPIALIATLLISCSDLPPEDHGGSRSEEGKNSDGKTEDGHDVMVFQEGDLDNILIRIDTTAMSEEGFSGTVIFKDMKPEDIPNVGDIMASGTTEDIPYGFLYKVQGVSTTNGITAAVVKSASLEEAIEDANFESETEFEFDEDGNLLKMLMKSNNVSSNVSVPLNLSKEIVFVKNDNIEGKLTAGASYTITFVFNIEIKSWRIQSTKMAIKQDGRITLNGSIKGQVEKNIRKELGRVNLPNITFWVGVFPFAIPVVVTNDLVLNLKIAGKAEAGMEATYTLNTNGEYGFEYRNGTFYKIAQSSLTHSFEYEQYMSGEIRTGINATLETKLYGVAGLALDAGPALKLSVEGRPIGTYVFDDGFQLSENNGVYLDFGLDFAANITLGMLGFNVYYKFAEGWITLRTLYEASFLPSFDELQISVSDSNVSIISGIRRDRLNYPIKNYGFCIEKAAGECKNNRGIKKVLGAGVRSGEYRVIDTTFNDIEGESYTIRPYFENGVGGTYYDKEVNVVQGVVQSSTSNSGNCEAETYNTVVIGTQVWMVDNLNCNVSGSKCYDDRNVNCAKYGRLYDWATAMTVCPSGWHLPSDAEWTTLTNFVGGLGTAGKHLKAASGWDGNGNGLDSHNFSALPGGLNYSGILFSTVGNGGYWWTATENNANSAWYRGMYYDNDNVGRQYDNKSNLLSVRCLQD
jgi:uncharacterized protein (TIGR02145 family)